MARFQLYGRFIPAREQNEAPMTREEQNALPIELVYETDDQVEAAEIQRRGGFFRDRDQGFVSVTSVEDTLNPQGAARGSADAQPMPQKGE